eukprot:745575-Rhodomonas_salina.3
MIADFDGGVLPRKVEKNQRGCVHQACGQRLEENTRQYTAKPNIGNRNFSTMGTRNAPQCFRAHSWPDSTTQNVSSTHDGTGAKSRQTQDQVEGGQALAVEKAPSQPPECKGPDAVAAEIDAFEMRIGGQLSC